MSAETHAHATGSGYQAGCAGCQQKLRDRRAAPKLPRPTTEERFAAKWVLNDSGCWIWQGAIDPGGYGRFRYKGRMRLAHRASHEMFKAPIPEDRQIDHLCHTPAPAIPCERIP